MSAPKPISSILDTAGKTPVVELQRIARGSGRRIFAKCEFFGPTQSHKDRSARALMDEAVATGALQPGDPVIEVSTGSFGIALAQWCALNGHPLTVLLPESASLERRETLKLYGAKFELVANLKAGFDRMNQLAQDLPSAFFPAQFANEQAVHAYRDTLGAELVAQMDASGGAVHAFVAVGCTGAMIAGVAEALSSRGGVELWGVNSAEPFDMGSGTPLRTFTDSFLPAMAQGITRWLQVKPADALAMKNRLAREEGLLCGISSGFNVAAALALTDLPEDAHVWTILPDTGERYFSLESAR